MPRIATVFGGSGFIGRHLVQRLAKGGWQIRVACQRPSEAKFLQPLGDVGQITAIRAKLQDEAAVAAAAKGADAVINLCGVLYERGSQTFEAVHHKGAETAAKAAAAGGARAFVQVSAIGASKEAESRYAQTKAAGEEAVLAAYPKAAILRPSIIFGPEDNFFNLFASMSGMSPFLPLIGGGHTRFQPVFVGDVADAVMACLENPATQGQIYELGGPGVYSFKELLQMMLKETGRKRWLVNLPFGLAMAEAAVLELSPVPLLTRDQVTSLKTDNVVPEGALALADLGIEATPVEAVLPTYMERYRKGGRFKNRYAL